MSTDFVEYLQNKSKIGYLGIIGYMNAVYIDFWRQFSNSTSENVSFCQESKMHLQ